MVRGLLVAGLLLVVALSGCSATPDDADVESSSSNSSTNGLGSGSASKSTTSTGSKAPIGSASGANATPAAPRLLANVSALTGQIPWTLNVTIGGSDANGDAMTWNVTLDGVVAANGTTVPGNASIIITTAGSHVLNVTLTDGALGNTTSFNLTATAGAGALNSVAQDDPDGDAEVDFTEILDLMVSLDAGTFTLTANVADVPTGEDGLAFSPYGFRLTINGAIYRCYNYVGTDIWSVPDGAYIGGCTWDADADTIVMAISLETLAGADVIAPYTFNLVSYEGVLNNEVNVDDLVPDTGTLTVG